MKKGPLSKKEKAYIVKNYQQAAITVIAEKIDRSVHMVDKFIVLLTDVAENKERQDERSSTVEPVQESKPDNPLYARNVTENGVVRSTIGTQAASMAADESRKNRKEPENNVSPRMKSHIHVIKKR